MYGVGDVTVVVGANGDQWTVDAVEGLQTWVTGK